MQCGLEPKTTKQKRSEKINIGQFVSLLKNIKKRRVTETKMCGFCGFFI